MDFARVIYEVIKVEPSGGLICVKDEKGEKSEVRVSIEDNKRLLTEIKTRDKLEIEVNGWQVRRECLRSPPSLPLLIPILTDLDFPSTGCLSISALCCIISLKSQ